MKNSLLPVESPEYLVYGEIAEEVNASLQAGREPDVEGLVTRHPELADQIRELVPTLIVLERLGQEPVGLQGDSHAGQTIVALGQLGDFRIIREIGRGGMGVVYEAEQISLGRHVALKVLPFAAAMDAKQLQRFKNEAQAAAHLRHMNIVPVYSVGCERSVHYYAMQFVEGQTLAAMIADLRQAHTNPTRERGPSLLARRASESPRLCVKSSSDLEATKIEIVVASTSPVPRDSSFFRTVANLGIQAAEALDHAHSEGIIHRDIKPSNLLVDIKGNLWITDFGLARLGTDGGLTMSGDLLGTLRYMSPEQALAKRVIVDHRSDIYSLGVTLYELLTLEPAIKGNDREEILRRIAFDEPKPLRKISKSIPAELETIVFKAIGKSPEERYGTAQEVADDLRRWLEDKPIKARRPTPYQRLLKWSRRHKAVIRAATASAVIGLTILVIVLGVSHVRIESARADLAQALFVELEAKKELEGKVFYQRWALAERELRDANPEGFLRLGLENLRRWVQHPTQPQPTRTFRGHRATCFGVAYSPDGLYIASAGLDNAVKIWDANTGTEHFVLPPMQSPVRVAFSPDGRHLAVASVSRVFIWDLVNRRMVTELLPAFQGVSIGFSKMGGWGVAYSPDGQRIAAGGAGSIVTIWDAATGAEQRRINGGYMAVAFSPDSRLIASAVHLPGQFLDTAVKIWDVQTGKEIRSLQSHLGSVYSLAFSTDSRHIASASLDETVRVGELSTGHELLILRGHANVVTGVAYSPDGRYLASTGLDGTVRVWDAETGDDMVALHHGAPLSAVAFRPDGKYLAVAGGPQGSGRITIWDSKLWEKK